VVSAWVFGDIVGFFQVGFSVHTRGEGSVSLFFVV
jgi:hypothetical protein